MRQVPTCQRAGRPGGEGIHVGLEDDVVGDGPALPACLKTSMSWSTVPISTQGLARSLSGLNCIQRLANSSAASQRWSVTTTRCTSAFSSRHAYRSPAPSRMSRIRLSTSDTLHPEMSGAAPPRRKVFPDKPTISASRAASVRMSEVVVGTLVLPRMFIELGKAAS
jgi:hypothetical protein